MEKKKEFKDNDLIIKHQNYYKVQPSLNSNNYSFNVI